MSSTVADVLAVLDLAYPPGLAEPWDTGIGLTCGDPDADVRVALLSVDVTAAVVQEAIDTHADVLVTHHPLLFRPVQSVAAGTDKGALLHRLIRNGIAHLAAHTNADKAVGGVNDALAETLGLLDIGPLLAEGPPKSGSAVSVDYPPPVRLSAFAEEVRRALPATPTGLRWAGDPDRSVSVVAVCGGAGSSVLAYATQQGADAVVTSDLSHHVVSELLDRPHAPAVVEVSHWAGEWPWLKAAAELLRAAIPGVDVVVSTRCTDPWTGRVPDALLTTD